MSVTDWDQRQLCPDGGCVGLIGPDGTCRVCGRVAPDWGDERRRGLMPAEADDADGGEADDAEHDEISPSAPAAMGPPAAWHERKLCEDGACIGVIGRDGRCSVCGVAADGVAVEDSELEADAESDGDSEAESDSDDDADSDSDPDPDPDPDSDPDADSDSDPDSDPASASGSDDSALGDRELCPDGACIGVIGDDGKCKVCGAEAA